MYFIIYPNATNPAKPKIQVEVELALDGRVLGSQTSELPAVNADGTIPLTIAPPAKPGKNRLRVPIQQGTESVERVFRIHGRNKCH